MTNQYGPWATLIDVGGSPQLSAFWRRRMGMLVQTSETSPVLSRRSVLALAGTGLLAIMLPTFRLALAVEPQTNSASPLAVTIDDLQMGASKRESALKSFSVTVKYHIRRRGNAVGIYETLDARDSCIFDNGRIRCEETADIPGNKSRLRRALAVFDGKETRLLEGSAAKQTPGEVLWASGRIGKEPYNFSWQSPPCDLFLREHGRPFDALLRDAKQNARVRGMTTWEGRPVVKVEVGPSVTDHTYRAIYLIDPARGFAVVRQASSIQFSPHTQWIEYARRETFGYSEIAPGVWLPRRAFGEFSNVSEECVTKDVAPELWWRGEVQFDGWRLHPKSSEDAFMLQFPVGIPIDDDRPVPQVPDSQPKRDATKNRNGNR